MIQKKPIVDDLCGSNLGLVVVGYPSAELVQSAPGGQPNYSFKGGAYLGI